MCYAGCQNKKGFEDMKVVAIADVCDDLLNEYKERLKVPAEKCFGSAEELLSEEKLADCIIIATMDKDHYVHALRAIEKGYDILLEKPISANEAECEEINQKAKEKGAYRASDKMKRVAKALPAVERALKVQKAAAKAGFDFESAEAAAKKLPEETAECLAAKDATEREIECGDLLFAAVNVVRLLKCDPEIALSRAVRKFESRYAALEQLAAKPVSELSPKEADELWEEVKRRESRRDI